MFKRKKRHAVMIYGKHLIVVVVDRMRYYAEIEDADKNVIAVTSVHADSAGAIAEAMEIIERMN